MKGHGDMTLGLDVTYGPRQRLSFSSWQEYRLSLGQLIKKMLFLQQPLPELVMFFHFYFDLCQSHQGLLQTLLFV